VSSGSAALSWSSKIREDVSVLAVWRNGRDEEADDAREVACGGEAGNGEEGGKQGKDPGPCSPRDDEPRVKEGSEGSVEEGCAKKKPIRLDEGEGCMAISSI